MDAFFQKQGHGLFVGGIQDRRHRAPRPAGGVGQFHAGVLGPVRRPEGELADLGQVQAAPGGVKPLGPAEAGEDRQLHVRPTQLG